MKLWLSETKNKSQDHKKIIFAHTVNKKEGKRFTGPLPEEQIVFRKEAKKQSEEQVYIYLEKW